jgi:hypothetical protein
MKNFKRILDKSGIYRYYVNGKQITAKKGASEYVKRNFAELKPDQLSRQEQVNYRNKIAAKKGAEKARQRLKDSYRFKGKLLDSGVAQFFKKLKKEERNIEKLYPGIKDYGQLLKELQKDLKENMELFELNDVSQYGLPNEKRNRTNIENTADIIDTLKNDYPGYDLIVFTERGRKITNYKDAIKYITQWELKLANKNLNKSYLKITYFPIIDIVNKLLIIDLTKKKKEEPPEKGKKKKKKKKETENRYTIQLFEDTP